MKSWSYLAAVGLAFLGLVGWSVASAGVLATVNSDSITVGDFLKSYRLAATAGQGPENTPEGKKEFLETVISARLLSQHFRDKGFYTFVDTFPVYKTFMADFMRGQYIQALYHNAIPEAREVGLADVETLMELSRSYVDSLQTAYDLQVDEMPSSSSLTGAWSGVCSQRTSIHTGRARSRGRSSLPMKRERWWARGSWGGR